ncbi:MAG: hypothetical protein ACI9J3_004171 [Parvicellaceae bacterium]|jgi:hypothetical protein
MNYITITLLLICSLFMSCSIDKEGDNQKADYSTPEKTLETFAAAVSNWNLDKVSNCTTEPELEEMSIQIQKKEIIALYKGADCQVLNYYNNDSSAVFRVIGKDKGGSVRLGQNGEWKIFVFMNQVTNPFQ